MALDCIRFLTNFEEMCDIHAHRDFESIATNFFQIVPYFMVWPHCGILRGPGHKPCHKSLKLPGSRCVGTLWGWRFIPQLDSNSRDTCKRDNLSARKICFDVKWREQKWTLYCIHTRTNDRTKTIISLSLDVCLLMMSHIALLSQWDITCLLHILIPKTCNARTIEYNSKKAILPLNWKFHHKPLLVKNCRTGKFWCISIQLNIARSQCLWYKNCFAIVKPEKFLPHV